MATIGEPKSGDDRLQIRALGAVCRSAVKTRTQAANQLRARLFTGLKKNRAELRGVSTNKLLAIAARPRLGGEATNGLANAVAIHGPKAKWHLSNLFRLQENPC